MELMELLRFPCSETKRPLLRNGLYGARRDWPDDSGHPLIGVPTGSVNGFDCLDVDIEGLGWLNEFGKRLPPTRIHETRSGGKHIFFRHIEGVRNSAGRIAKSVDVRGQGGFIIWWPRQRLRVWDGEIAEWPSWLLLEAISPKRLVHVEETPMCGPFDPCGMGMTVGASSREARYSKAALRNAFDKLANEWPRAEGGGPKRGGRNDLLNKLGFKMGGLVANGWIDGERVVKVLMLAAADCGLVREDGREQCVATILSGLRAGLEHPYPPIQPWGAPNQNTVHTWGSLTQRPKRKAE